VLDDAANLSGAELELVGDCLESRLVVEMSFLETLNDQLRNPLCIVHRGAARRQLGTATQAGTEAGLLGLLCGIEEPAIGRLRGLHTTDRPAVDASRGDADKEHAVEPGVA
jgi:hypothetical protein